MIKYLYLKFTGDMYMTIKILMVAAMMMHAGYFIIFLIMGVEKLVVANIFSVLCYIVLIAIVFQDKQNLRIALAIFQFEVLFHAVICIIVLGFCYGFEMLFFALILNLLIINVSYKKLTYFMLAFSFILFVILFVFLFSKHSCDDFWTRFLFIYNFVLITFAFVIMTNLLEVSNSFEILKAKMQRSEMQNIANKDPLTGLLNRNSLNEFVSEFLYADVNFAIVIGDIDNFKMINDTYGHNVGDKAIVRVANVFKSVFRKNDLVCRWGGEEFLIIIYNVEPKIAFETIKRAKNLITSTPLNFEDKKIEITLTYGMVTHTMGSDIDISKMIKVADDLLYKGKKSGKNRIVTDENLS